jgi:hypothetical protein
MMRNVMGCVVLLFSSSLFGMQVLHQKVTLPSKDILKQRINGLTLPPQFDECTRLSHNLTNHTEYVGDILSCVTVALAIYNGLIEGSSAAPNDKAKLMAFLGNQKMVIVGAILQDQPAILAQIKDAQAQLPSFTNGQK